VSLFLGSTRSNGWEEKSHWLPSHVSISKGFDIHFGIFHCHPPLKSNIFSLFSSKSFRVCCVLFSLEVNMSSLSFSYLERCSHSVTS